LARIYTPAEFGTLAILVTVSNISAVVACLRYDIALPSAPERDARGLVITAISVAALLGATSSLVLRMLSGAAVGSAHFEELLMHPMLIGACVMLVGAYQATSAWLLRRNAFNGMAALRLSQGAAFCLLAAFSGAGLLWSHVASFVGGLIGPWQALRSTRDDHSTWVETSRRYFGLPLYNVPGSLFDVVGYSISTWVVAAS